MLAGVLLAAPGCRDEVVFAELSATRARLEACQAKNTTLEVKLARMEDDKDDDDDDDDVLPIISPPVNVPLEGDSKKKDAAPARAVSGEEDSPVELPPVELPVKKIEKVGEKRRGTPDAGLDEEPQFEIIKQE